jgi:hypothetical protein
VRYLLDSLDCFNFIVYPGSESYPVAEDTEVTGVQGLLDKLQRKKPK